MSQLKPVTPITAQLEKLLSPASVHPPHSSLAPPAAAPNATAAPTANAHPSSDGGESSGGADPSAALDNLFAAKFSFQFDNLQHILRYILGEIRTQKRQTLDMALLKERVSSLEGSSETVAALLNQSNATVKQTANLQGEVGKLEDKLTKDTSLLNRRVATLEVTCERMAANVTEQEQKLTQSLSKQSSASSLTPAQTALAKGGADNPFLPVGRKEGLEMDNMSSSISKLLQSQGATTAQLLERVKKLEEKEIDLKKEADTVHASMALLQNENKRLQTALQTVEEELKTVKRGNDLANATIGQVQATVAAVSRRSSFTNAKAATASPPAPLHPATPPTATTVAAAPTTPVIAPVAAKVSTPVIAAAPAPTLNSSSSSGSISFAVNLDAGRQQMLRATESTASLASNVSSVADGSAPATIAAPVAAPAAGVIADDSFESDLATMQANFEVKVLTQLAELRKELDDKWSVEKEISRENKKSIMEAVTAASEAAIDAKAAFEHTKAAGEEIEARIAKIPAPKQPTYEEDEQLAQRLLEQAAEANLVLFAGVESVTSKSPAIKPLTPSGGSGHSRRPSFNLSAPAASPTPPLGAERPPLPPQHSPVLHVPQPHHSYNFSQQDFDRVKAMAELALRRTVQHSEVISQVESSGFKKDPAQAVTLLDLEKVKANASNVATRMLYLEDKLETINALTLATRNQTLALQTSVEDNPAFKSVHLRLFEYELKQNEIGDKVKLLAHMLQKGGVPVPTSPPPQTHTLAHTHGNVADLQQKSSATSGSNKANAQNRSLVSQLEEDEKTRKEASKAKKEAAAAVKQEQKQQAEADEVSDDESIRGSSQASMRPPSVAGGRSHHRAASKLAPGDTISESGNSEVATATIISGDGNEEVEATSVGYTDGLDEARSSLAMVLRDAEIPARSVEQLTKDLKALGHMHEKLSAVEALDAKLATIASLEAKVESLLDMDIKERLTFIERRFNTELTFLRSHVNTKVDASSLNILLNKLDFEGAIAGGAVVASVNERATSPRKIAIGGGRNNEDASPSRVDAAAVAASIHHPTQNLTDGQKGSMGRASGREARGKAASDVEKAARDRKQRLAHLLAMLDKKADHASIRALEEFVRSVDRHLRGMLARHSAQFKQLEASGLLQPGKIVKKRTGKPSTAGGNYDEEKARADGEDMTIHPHDTLYDSHEDVEFSEAEIDYVVNNAEDMPSRRQAVSDMLQAVKVAKKNSADEDAATAARVGFTISNSSSQFNQLHRRCEDLQMQIANLHSQLAKKQDRSNHGIGLHSRSNSSMHVRNSSADFHAGAGAGAASVGTPAAVGPAGGHPGGVSLTPASLDDLTLNPDLSLVDHPHYIRLATKSQMHEEELARVQSLVLYQSKQLRNHREWIAKHSREIGAIRQYVQFAQNQQAANVAAITSPTGSQTARNANENTSLTNVAVATSASYPSPAVFQILRQVEADILSLRRTMKQKIDFMDLGITNPHDQSQALPVSTSNYPHPSLEDLRRLLFYLTPQLSAGAGLPMGGGPHGVSFAHQAGYSGTDVNRVSMLATKGAYHVPPMNPDGSLAHTHGPGGPETWKCLACDRAMETMNTIPPAKLSRHKDMTATLSSVAPAGGVAGANTRRLIAAASPQALFQQSQSAKVTSSSQQMQPRPPNQAAGTVTPRAAAAQLAVAQTAVAPSNANPKSIAEQQALLLQQQQQLLLQQQQQQLTAGQNITGSNLTDPAYQAQLQAAREAETQQLVAAQIKAMKEQEKEEKAARKAEKKRIKAQLKAEAEAKALLEAQAQAKEQERAAAKEAEKAKSAAAAAAEAAAQMHAEEPAAASSARPTSASTRTTVAEVTIAAMEAQRNSPSFSTEVSVVSPSGRVRSIDFVDVVEQARKDQLGKERLTEPGNPAEEKAEEN